MILDTKQINPEYIKLRWGEPYVSHALNRKNFGVMPVGFFSGFGIEVISNRVYQVNNSAALNFSGSYNHYDRGAFNSSKDYSIATFQDTRGHNTTLSIPPLGVSGTFDFDLTGHDDEKLIAVLNSDYAISSETNAKVQLVTEDEIINSPDYLVIGVINIPSAGIPSSIDDIDYNDDLYPRTLPFADNNKYGFMSPKHVKQIDTLNAVFSSPNDADVYWFLDSVSAGVLQFNGDISYNIPTDNFDVILAVSGTSVSGIENNDIIYFTYSLDGSSPVVELRKSPDHSLPNISFNENLVVLGKRAGNDFYFKTGQKWEVGEEKPFGVTSKYPNLRVGESGNPPFSDSVSGIFFDNARVHIQPGGRDVHIFCEVSGVIPPEAIEEQFVVTDENGEDIFTTTIDDLYWMLDHSKTEISVTRNGQKLVQYSDMTSGIYYSDGNPVWGYKKVGTRTIQTSKKLPLNSVVTIRIEANRGVFAYEENYLVDSVSGQNIFNTIRSFAIDNNVKDIVIFHNGVKIQYAEYPFNLGIYAGQKTGPHEFTFIDPVLKDGLITFRWEGAEIQKPYGDVSGDFWYTPVDSDIVPEYNNFYDIGSILNKFRDGNFSRDLNVGENINVSGAIYSSEYTFVPKDSSIVRNNTLFSDKNNYDRLSFKDNFGNVTTFEGGTSGISFDETEVMINPYPFSISAPRAVSVSSAGDFFVLTDFTSQKSMDDFLGILTQNVSAYGSGQDIAFVKWRGRTTLNGFNNGAVYVSGITGELSQQYPTVSGEGYFKIGLVKNDDFFIRPSEPMLI